MVRGIERRSDKEERKRILRRWCGHPYGRAECCSVVTRVLDDPDVLELGIRPMVQTEWGFGYFLVPPSPVPIYYIVRPKFVVDGSTVEYNTVHLDADTLSSVGFGLKIFIHHKPAPSSSALFVPVPADLSKFDVVDFEADTDYLRMDNVRIIKAPVLIPNVVELGAPWLEKIQIRRWGRGDDSVEIADRFVRAVARCPHLREFGVTCRLFPPELIAHLAALVANEEEELEVKRIAARILVPALKSNRPTLAVELEKRLIHTGVQLLDPWSDTSGIDLTGLELVLVCCDLQVLPREEIDVLELISPLLRIEGQVGQVAVSVYLYFFGGGEEKRHNQKRYNYGCFLSQHKICWAIMSSDASRVGQYIGILSKHSFHVGRDTPVPILAALLRAAKVSGEGLIRAIPGIWEIVDEARKSCGPFRRDLLDRITRCIEKSPMDRQYINRRWTEMLRSDSPRVRHDVVEEMRKSLPHLLRKFFYSFSWATATVSIETLNALDVCLENVSGHKEDRHTEAFEFARRAFSERDRDTELLAARIILTIPLFKYSTDVEMVKTHMDVLEAISVPILRAVALRRIESALFLRRPLSYRELFPHLLEALNKYPAEELAPNINASIAHIRSAIETPISTLPVPQTSTCQLS